MTYPRYRDTRNERDHKPLWSWYRHWHRFRFGIRVYRHLSHLPDRWVFQPSLVYDRKTHVTDNF